MSSLPVSAVPPAPARATPRRLKIALLIASNGWGGMEMHAAHLANGLADRGHEVTLVELDEPVFRAAGEADPRVQVTSPDFGGLSGRVGWWRWWRYFRGFGCDVALFEKGGLMTGSLALDLAGRAAFPRYLVLEQLDPPARPLRSSRRHLGGLVPGLGIWWYRNVLRVRLRSIGPHRVITVSRSALEELKQYGYPPAKLLAVQNGIDVARNRPDPKARAAARARWRIPADATVFGTVARLDCWHKGQDIAMAQFAELVKQQPRHDLWYVLVGEGPDRSALEAQAASLGIRERTVFPGFSPRPWEDHAGIDITLLASQFEGTPLTLAEAMAAGSCPIAMGVGGVPELIPDPGLGWLVSPRDRAGFLAAMKEALALTADARIALGKRAREHIVQHFNADAQYAKLVQLIETG
jgi:glycosyltransferase involved in cell wall biosynthesis